MMSLYKKSALLLIAALAMAATSKVNIPLGKLGIAPENIKAGFTLMAPADTARVFAGGRGGFQPGAVSISPTKPGKADIDHSIKLIFEKSGSGGKFEISECRSYHRCEAARSSGANRVLIDGFEFKVEVLLSNPCEKSANRCEMFYPAWIIHQMQNDGTADIKSLGASFTVLQHATNSIAMVRPLLQDLWLDLNLGTSATGEEFGSLVAADLTQDAVLILRFTNAIVLLNFSEDRAVLVQSGKLLMTVGGVSRSLVWEQLATLPTTEVPLAAGSSDILFPSGTAHINWADGADPHGGKKSDLWKPLVALSVIQAAYADGASVADNGFVILSSAPEGVRVQLLPISGELRVIANLVAKIADPRQLDIIGQSIYVRQGGSLMVLTSEGLQNTSVARNSAAIKSFASGHVVSLEKSGTVACSGTHLRQKIDVPASFLETGLTFACVEDAKQWFSTSLAYPGYFSVTSLNKDQILVESYSP